MGIQIEIEEVNEDEVIIDAAALGALCPDRREKVLRINNPRAKALAFCAGKLLTKVLCRELKMRPDEVVLCTWEHGKPYVKEAPEFYFSLTHTQGLCAVAYGDRPCGLDCEKIRYREKDQKVAKRCFAPSEYAYIYGDIDQSIDPSVDPATAERIAERFFRIWTMKESYLKYNGRGITVPLNSFVADPASMTVASDDVRYTESRRGPYILMLCETAKQG